jgi:hypothetical protein
LSHGLSPQKGFFKEPTHIDKKKQIKRAKVLSPRGNHSWYISLTMCL